jgi:hypothetical protein
VSSRPPGQGLTYVALAVGGLLLGVVGAGLSSVRIDVAGVTVPWGLVLVLVALAVGARSAAWLVGSRGGAVAVALGWALPTLVFASLSPGGDVLLPDLPRTYVYLLGGALLAAFVCVVPLPAGAALAAVATDLADPYADEEL